MKGELVELQPLQRDFFDEYLSMFSPVVREPLRVPSLENEHSYLEQQLKKAQQGQTHFYCIFDTADQQLIGAIEIRDSAENAGQLYCWLNERFWGGGRYQEALELAAQSYFQATGQRYFTAHVDIANKRSYFALKKCGFADLGLRHGPYGLQYTLALRKKPIF